MPIPREYIKAKAGDDGIVLYNAWINQYEFQRPFVAPPGVPRERVEILRKAFAQTFQDPEFPDEAKKSKLYMEYVSANEMSGLINEIRTLVSQCDLNKISC